jgi:hypothetical protein
MEPSERIVLGLVGAVGTDLQRGSPRPLVVLVAYLAM